ncbi:alpha/beta-hydrolase, partial [Coprinellus micaceus]
PHTTLTYKTISDGLDIHIDVWAPPKSAYQDGHGTLTPRPAFVYFHGGGLAVGAREVWIPEWLFNRLTSRGYLFISADYRLVPPSTGYDILEDVKALWAYITARGFSITFPPGDESVTLEVDPNAIAVGGSSAGGFLTYLAAMHCRSPRPAAIAEIYGLCGQIFSSYYLSPKIQPFKFSFKSLNLDDFKDFVYPFPMGPPPAVARSLPEYAGEDHPLGPEYPANPRMQLIWLYGQHGVALDYITGQHEPSFSELLRDRLGLGEKRRTVVEDVVLADIQKQREVVEELAGKPEERHLKMLFAQFNVDKSWPPAVFLHGTGDTGLPIQDSEHMFGLLKEHGIPTELYSIEREEHAFDYGSDAEEKWGQVGGEFDKVVEFVDRYTGRGRDKYTTLSSC